MADDEESPSQFQDEQAHMEYFSTLLDQRKRTLEAEINASDISQYVRGRVADEVASRMGGAGGATAATVLEIMPTPTQAHSSVFSPSKAKPKRPGSAPPARSLAEQWSRLTLEDTLRLKETARKRENHDVATKEDLGRSLHFITRALQTTGSNQQQWLDSALKDFHGEMIAAGRREQEVIQTMSSNLLSNMEALRVSVRTSSEELVMLTKQRARDAATREEIQQLVAAVKGQSDIGPKIEKIQHLIETINLSESVAGHNPDREAILTVRHQGAVRQLKVRAADELNVVEFALRSVFGLSNNAEFVLLDSQQLPVTISGRLPTGEYTLIARERPVVVQREAKAAEETKTAEVVVSAFARRQSVATPEKNTAQMSSDTRLSTPTKGAIDPREFQELKARIEKMNETIERIDRHQNRIKTLSIKHKEQLRQLKVVASDDHIAVDAAIRSVFGLLPTMDYVLLDADGRPVTVSGRTREGEYMMVSRDVAQAIAKTIEVVLNGNCKRIKIHPEDSHASVDASVKTLFGLPPTAPCQLYNAEGMAVTMSGRLMPDCYTLHVAGDRSSSLGHDSNSRPDWVDEIRSMIMQARQPIIAQPDNGDICDSVWDDDLGNTLHVSELRPLRSDGAFSKIHAENVHEAVALMHRLREAFGKYWRLHAAGLNPAVMPGLFRKIVEGRAVALDQMDLFDKLLLINDTQGGELDRLVAKLIRRPEDLLAARGPQGETPLILCGLLQKYNSLHAVLREVKAQAPRLLVSLLAQKVSLREVRSSNVMQPHEYSRPSAAGLSSACVRLAHLASAATKATTGCTHRLRAAGRRWLGLPYQPPNTARESGDKFEIQQDASFEGKARHAWQSGVLNHVHFAVCLECGYRVTETVAGLNLLHIAVLHGDLHLVDSLLSLLKYSIEESDDRSPPADSNGTERVDGQSDQMAPQRRAPLASEAESALEGTVAKKWQKAASAARRSSPAQGRGAPKGVARMQRLSALAVAEQALLRSRASLSTEVATAATTARREAAVVPPRRDSRSLSPPKDAQKQHRASLSTSMAGGAAAATTARREAAVVPPRRDGRSLSPPKDAQKQHRAPTSSGALTRRQKSVVHPAPSSPASPADVSVRGRWPGRGGGTVEDMQLEVHADDLPGGSEVCIH
jgi:hypothetical protein